MALVSDLMGLGTPAELAGKLGHQVATLAAAGTTQAAATPITNSVTIATTGASATGLSLPTNPSLLKEFYVFNTTATSAVVYPRSGGSTLNGGTGNTVTVAQNKGAMFMCLSGAGGTAPQWVSISGA